MDVSKTKNFNYDNEDEDEDYLDEDKEDNQLEFNEKDNLKNKQNVLTDYSHNKNSTNNKVKTQEELDEEEMEAITMLRRARNRK